MWSRNRQVEGVGSDAGSPGIGLAKLRAFPLHNTASQWTVLDTYPSVTKSTMYDFPVK